MKISVLALVCLFGATLFAQETGTILGTVTDATGSAIPNAKLTITNNQTGLVRNVTTNESGSYIAPDLRIGTYNIRADVPGFKSYEQTGVTLNVNATVRADIALQVGEAKQSVTVEANAVQVQSDTSEVSDVITSQQITQLDTNGRNPIQLATLVPGAASSLPDFNAPTALSSNNNISFNGQRPQHNLWLIDGGENYDRGSGGGMIVSPSPDALAEFRVLTSNYSAEFGQASGGTINIAIKSGTKQLHGAAWEFNRNDYFDANDFFANKNGQPKPELRYNAFGFNIGGPVVIPKIYSRQRSKTFFFYNMEWRRLIQGTQINATAIPAPEFGGNFSNLLAGSSPVQLKVPQTQDPAAIAKFAQYGLAPGQPFPGNIIPSGLIDPNAQALLNAGIFPKPNSVDGTHFLQAAPVPTYLREEIARIDHQFSDKVNLMAHGIYDSSSNAYATALWSSDTYPTIGTSLAAPSFSTVVRLTEVITPTLLNEVSWDFNGNKLTLSPTGLFQKPAGYNVPEFFAANNLNRIPTIQIQSPYNVNYDTASWPWHNDYWSHTIRDDVSWTHGNHNFKFGFYYMLTRKNQDIFGNTNGNYIFNGGFTGNSFADFLLGYANSYSELDIQDAVHIRTNNYAAYVADNWRVTPRLTLNLGLRWEGVPHAYDINGRLSNFYPGLYNSAQAPQFNPDGSLNTSGPGFSTVAGIPLSNTPFYLNGIGLAGQNGIPQGLVKNHWLNFGPRVGFAYDITGHQRTILRGGYGMFYERIQGNDVYNMGPNPPFSYNPSPNNVYFSNPTISDVTGLGASAPVFPSSFTALAYTDYKLPTSTQYSFGVEHQLSQSAFASLAYVGSHDYHLPDQRNINTVPLSDPNRLAICGGNCNYTGSQYNANLDRIYPGYAGITLTEAATTSNYNSLQASIRVQAGARLTFQGAYTYSHALDYVSADLNTLSNPFNRAYDYASGDFDRRHIAIFSYVYQLPFFTNANHHLTHALLGGWELSGITMFETGTPLNITLGYDNLGLGGGTTNRPNVVGNLTYPQSVQEWFNTAAFAAPPPLQFGTAARNVAVGPGRDNWNVAIFKAFYLPWREGMRVEFRGESYNTFNHTQFNAVDTTFSDKANFGQVTSVFDPRVIQLGAKFVF